MSALNISLILRQGHWAIACRERCCVRYGKCTEEDWQQLQGSASCRTCVPGLGRSCCNSYWATCKLELLFVSRLTTWTKIHRNCAAAAAACCATHAQHHFEHCLFMLPLAMIEHMHVLNFHVLPACSIDCCVGQKLACTSLALTAVSAQLSSNTVCNLQGGACSYLLLCSPSTALKAWS